MQLSDKDKRVAHPLFFFVILVFGTYTDVTPRQFFNVQVSKFFFPDLKPLSL